MILVKVFGGLGNQMFQYAFGRALANNIKTDLLLDTSLLKVKEDNTTKREYELDVFSIRANFVHSHDLHKYRRSYINRVNRKLNKVFSIPIISKSKVIYEEEYEEMEVISRNELSDTMLYGNWQSEKYFKNYEEEIKNDFKFKRTLDEINYHLVQRIKDVNSVSIHIRRGDYAENPEINSTHGLCTVDYYTRSINYINQTIHNPVYFVFSDDIEWVKRNLVIDNEHEMVTWNKNRSSYVDMQLMSICKNNIIANSSFSWWGAWLNINPEKIVIAPIRWYEKESRNVKANNLIPGKWIRL